MATITKARNTSFVATEKKNNNNTMSAAERRYRAASSKLRSIQRSTIQKEDQVELAHLIGYIESYGFAFFPNHYVYDEIVRLESIVNKLRAN